MDEFNPYQRPAAAVALEPRLPGQLAERGDRLAAVLLDSLLAVVIVAPVMYVGGYFDTVASAASRTGEWGLLGTKALWSLIGFAVFVALQGYPLATQGQTWGKRAMGIKIVDLDGNKPPLWRLIALRYLPVKAVGTLPLIGSLLVLVDTLMIFRNDRRCLHDLVAGTCVVSAR